MSIFDGPKEDPGPFLNGEDPFESEEDFCSFEKPTGDTRWPVLCDKDNQFASRDECDDCKAEMRRKREATSA